MTKQESKNQQSTNLNEAVIKLKSQELLAITYAFHPTTRSKTLKPDQGISQIQSTWTICLSCAQNLFFSLLFSLSLFFFFFFVHEVCGILSPQQRIDFVPSAQEGRFVTTGLSGKPNARDLLLKKVQLWIVSLKLGLHLFLCFQHTSIVPLRVEYAKVHQL